MATISLIESGAYKYAFGVVLQKKILRFEWNLSQIN